jgi:predicted dehydrogenase
MVSKEIWRATIGVLKGDSTVSKKMSRRELMKLSAAAGGLLLNSNGLTQGAQSGGKPIRVGFVGVGDRGSYHLDAALGIEGVEVPALCDIKDSYLYRAKRWVEEAGHPSPSLYGQNETDFERLCQEEDLDLVVCSTSWKWHAPVCIAAMKNDKNAVTEVPMMLTLDEGWELIETAESTGKWASIGLEQALLEYRNSMALLNMVRQGLLGELLHCEGGYVHDLRLVKFDPEREPWRLQHSVRRNGNLYPDHPMSVIMSLLDINHGDRLDYLVSMSSASRMLNEYAKQFYGGDHPYAKQELAQGDYNATLLHTAGGKMITLNFDTNTPHPREFFRVQGTKGVFFDGDELGTKIYIDGQSPKEHSWEDAKDYIEKYDHPLLRDYDPPPRKALRGHGREATETPLTWHLLVQALRSGETSWFDVYDSVTSSAISPLSEMSVAEKSQPVEFPDFTKGKWKTRPPIDFSG